MTKRILVMGLPGAGKTTFSEELVKRLMMRYTVTWYNADMVREMHSDWDFSDAGRKRQVERMHDLAQDSTSDYVICDFVCPTEDLRKTFDADIVIWLDTIKEGRFEDTNKAFVPPTKFDYRITDWDAGWVKRIAKDLGDVPSESNVRSITKAISWRTLGTLDTFLISWLITGHVGLAAAIGGTEVFTKIALFWLHERAWNKVRWGRN